MYFVFYDCIISNQACFMNMAYCIIFYYFQYINRIKIFILFFFKMLQTKNFISQEYYPVDHIVYICLLVFSSLNFVSIVIRYSFMSTLKCQLCVSKIYTEIFTRVFEYSVEHSIVKRQITKRRLYKIPLRVCGHNYKGLLTRKSCFRF